MNTTFETVWELSTARIPWGLRPIIPCITLNFPNVAPPTRGFNYVSKNAYKKTLNISNTENSFLGSYRC